MNNFGILLITGYYLANIKNKIFVRKNSAERNARAIAICRYYFSFFPLESLLLEFPFVLFELFFCDVEELFPLFAVFALGGVADG